MEDWQLAIGLLAFAAVLIIVTIVATRCYLRRSSERRKVADAALYFEEQVVSPPVFEETVHESKLSEQEKADEAAAAALKPFYYFVPSEAVLACEETTLGRWQELQAKRILVRRQVDLVAAFRDGVEDTLFVSHRWEALSQPDSQGTQLAAVQQHLRAHEAIKFVWYDFWCMPQRKGPEEDDRTPSQRREFDLMLKGVADLYLTMRVLVLLDMTYMGRFWTQLEAWCSMQKTTPDGLRPAATAEEQRYTIDCLHNADPDFEGRKVQLLAVKSPQEMVKLLASPDVVVTNQKDKEAMLPTLEKTNVHVKEIFGHVARAMVPE